MQGHHQAHLGGRYGADWLHRWPDFGARNADTSPGEVVPEPVPTQAPPSLDPT
jgi:hypothetical protein